MNSLSKSRVVAGRLWPVVLTAAAILMTGSAAPRGGAVAPSALWPGTTPSASVRAAWRWRTPARPRRSDRVGGKLADFQDERRRATPEADPSPIDDRAIVKASADLPRLHSLLVSWRGSLILERYFNGARATRLANIKSVSKSIISALVGMAIDRRLIASVRQPIGSFFGDLLVREADAPKRQITVENLLSMQSGLASTSNRNYGAWVRSPNWVRHALGRPLESLPGTDMEYSTGNTHLLSAILSKASGKSTWQFAQDALARPLGFSLAQWPRDPQGVYFGGNEMLLTPRQMIAFGELYLHRGRANGRQIVPEDWVDTSFVPRTRSNFSDQMYGYGWWIREMAGVRTYVAWGYGGQFIFVVPDLDLVIASTSASTVSDDRRSHRRTLDDLIERLVIEPIASSTTPADSSGGR